MLPKSLCFVDIETTGASFSYNRIIEIGVLRVDEGVVTETFNTLINPGCSIPPEIEVLTGINGAMVEQSPYFWEIKDSLFEILKDAVFVAHNVRFDYAFLKSEFKKVGVNFNSRQLCTVKLSRKLYPQYRHHNLDSVIERLGFECEKRHRAFEDANVLWQFYQHILKNFDHKTILESYKKVTKRPTLPVRLSEKDLDKLPESPGVYIFYGEKGMPLYVGKSINVKERVLSHFCADIASITEMKISQQIESIEVVPADGELGALLKEAALIKKLQPLYNKKSRYSRKLTLLTGSSNLSSSKYSQVDLEDTQGIDIDKLDKVLAVFKNKRTAKQFLIKIVKEHNLCEKLLGLEKTKGACFGYRLGRCLGACIGKELPLKYNLRFQMAFSKTKVKQWPFKKPILITEGERAEGFIVDKWCFLGMVSNEDDLVIKEKLEFNLESYKILSKFIFSQKSLKNIKEVDIPIGYNV